MMARTELADVDSLLDLEESAEFMAATERELRRMVKAGLVPCVRLPGSRALRFRKAVLTEIAKRYEVPAAVRVKDETEVPTA